MLLNNFTKFVVPESDTLAQFSSPASERSLFKNIPILMLNEVRTTLKKIERLDNCKFKVRYRGPRYDGMRQTTLKRHARAFSVYFD